MQAVTQILLLSAMDAREVSIVLRNVCAAFGEVAGTGVVCSADGKSPREITGFVEMKEKIAIAVARRLGAGNVGTRLVVFRYRAPKGYRGRAGSELKRALA